MGGSPVRAITRIVKPTRTTCTYSTSTNTQQKFLKSTATSMDGYDARKTKAKGRSMTIMTGPGGVEDQTVTLGKKSLLGA